MMLPYRGLGATPSPAVQTALQNASSTYGVPLPLLTSVARSESAYNPTAVSKAGAQGLMQLMPATAASLGVTNPFDPQQSANGGAQYLAQLYSQYGDWNTALIAYNEGPGALATHGAYPSSQQYAQTILTNAGMDSSQALQSVPGPSDTTSDISATDTPTMFSDASQQPASGTDYTVPVVLGAAALVGLALFA